MNKEPEISSFSLLDHTGDTGLLLRAPSLLELFRQAARGFYAVLLENPAAVALTVDCEISLEENDVELLLVSWLTELNYHFNVLGKLYREFDIQVTERQLLVKLHGAEFDPKQHQILREIKAITFHQLEVRQIADQSWTARIVFDI
jgi:SHS2 domain-containing protein